MGRKQAILYFSIVMFLHCLTACDELPCKYTNGVQLTAGFYSYNGVTLSDTSLQNLTLELRNDDDSSYQIKYNNAIQTISFPLSMLADSSLIVLNYSDLKSDTIIIRYTKSLHLESHQCGFDEFFEINNISSSNQKLDSIWISNEIVDYVQTEHLKIYF